VDILAALETSEVITVLVVHILPALGHPALLRGAGFPPRLRFEELNCLCFRLNHDEKHLPLKVFLFVHSHILRRRVEALLQELAVLILQAHAAPRKLHPQPALVVVVARLVLRPLDKLLPLHGVVEVLLELLDLVDRV